MSHFTLKCLSYFLARYAIPYKHISCLNLMVTQYLEVVISCYLLPLKKGPGWWEFSDNTFSKYKRTIFYYVYSSNLLVFRSSLFDTIKNWSFSSAIKMLASRPRYQVVQKSNLWFDSILARFKRIQDSESWRFFF